MEQETDWLSLPDHIIIETFSYLNQYDLFPVSLVCKDWNQYFHTPQLWKRFQFEFYSPADAVQTKCLDMFASVMRSVVIKVNQAEEECREAACNVIKHFASIPLRRLEKFTIRFVGQNPLLYSGQEFLEALVQLFGTPVNELHNESHLSTFREIDLSGLKMNLDPSLIYLLSANNCKTLQKLNLQNGVLVGNDHPFVIKHLVSQCHELTHLNLHGYSINDEVIMALTEPPTRKKIQVLSIFCRRDQKYLKEISSEAWTSLVRFSPSLKVTLGFDHTCPIEILLKVMKPEIPIDVLLLETGTPLTKEIELAVLHYHQTLVKLTVFSPPQTNLGLDSALLFAVNSCKLLRSLHVFCVLKKETIDYILENNEYLRTNETYTLKYLPESGPWTPGKGYY